MNRCEVLRVGLDAYLDSQIILKVNVPGARMANHFAVPRFRKERSLPKRRGQWLETERLEKTLRVANHSLCVYIFRAQRRAHVWPRARIRRREERVDVVPFLRPHVAEQVRRNRSV